MLTLGDNDGLALGLSEKLPTLGLTEGLSDGLSLGLLETDGE